MRRLILAAAIAALLAVAYILVSQLGIRPSGSPDNISGSITLPAGFGIEVFAELDGSPISIPGPNPGPRMMLLKEGVLFVSVTNQGRVLALPDRDSDGKADQAITFISGLSRPHGLDYSDGWFYIAEETRVIRARDDDGNLVADAGSLEVLVPDLPAGGHFTRTVKVRDGKLYISAGSSCNVCIEQDPRRAAITTCNLDGTNCTVFARGLRNAVGFVFHPETGKIYATENGRDWLGDNLPPDEINLIEEGGNYGWPICYGKNVHDTDFDKNVYIRDPCMEPFETPSLVNLQAHSAPLGLAFYTGTQFPEEYRGDLFVAFHGSWNRAEPTGYKIVSIDMGTLEVKDFATGWLQPGRVLGRPVDIIEKDGSLLVSDDNGGRIYRIFYKA